MTDGDKKLADMEAAIETKDSRTRALLREKEDKITRVGSMLLYSMFAH